MIALFYWRKHGPGGAYHQDGIRPELTGERKKNPILKKKNPFVVATLLGEEKGTFRAGSLH